MHARKIAAPRLWLTRHGESEFNRLGLVGGDSNLTETGRSYAQQLPADIAARLPQGQELVVWTSTLKRTRQTAQHLPFPKLRWKALDEINAGICDGLTYEQIAEIYPAEYEARKKDKLRYRYPGGESYEDVAARVAPVVEALGRERRCVLVVAHQAVLRTMYGCLMGIPPEEVPRLHIPQHALIELVPMPDGSLHEERIPAGVPCCLSQMKSQVQVQAGMEAARAEAAAGAAAAGTQAAGQAEPGGISPAVPRGAARCGSGAKRLAHAISAVLRVEAEPEIVADVESAGMLLVHS